MTGYQFTHIETYARTPSALRGAKRAEAGKTRAKGEGGWSARQILAEAMREVGACPHVAAPQVPVVLAGDLAHLAREIDELEVNPPAKQRRDTPILLAGVMSAPWPPGDPRSARWRADVVEYLQKEWPDGHLRAVVAHSDEKHDHVHFYVTAPHFASVKPLHPGFRARAEVAQEQAKAEVGDEKKGLGRAQAASYTDAMKAYQDRYHAAVGREHGMARLGPKRRRLTRKEWKVEQTQAAALTVTRDLAAQAQAEIEQERAAHRIQSGLAAVHSITRNNEIERKTREVHRKENKVAQGWDELAQVRSELEQERARFEALYAVLSPEDKARVTQENARITRKFTT